MHSQNVQNIGRHRPAFNALWVTVTSEIHFRALNERKTLEQGAVLLPIQKDTRGNGSSFGVLTHSHQLTSLLVWQGPEQYAIDDAEDGRVGANAQREDEHRNGGK